MLYSIDVGYPGAFVVARNDLGNYDACSFCLFFLLVLMLLGMLFLQLTIEMMMILELRLIVMIL